ncbi:MAG: transposase [Polyangiaceae bacterium]|nr:transposase [Polyangiaceae bacterium]
MDAAVWVGIDWGHDEHQVCVLDEKRNVVLEDRMRHSPEGLRALVAKVLSFCAPERIAVAIETPRGPVWSLALFHRLSTTLYRDAPGEFSRAS